MEIKLLQIGPPKCGNYWLYNIIQQIYRLKGIGYKSFISKQPVYGEAQDWDLSHSLQAGIDMMDIERGKCFYRISSAFRTPIADLDEYLSHTNHVWTHSEVGENILPVLQRFNKRVYIYRDPRDMAVSAARYAFTPYMMKYYPHNESSVESYLQNNLQDIVQSWIWHVTDYLLLKGKADIHFLAYERLLEDFDATLAKLGSYLNLPLNRDEINEIAQRVDFRRLQAKDPGHVRKGKRFQWVNAFTEDKKERIVDKAGPLLKLLGYPEEPDEKLPEDANQFDFAAVKEVEQELKSPGVSKV